MHEVLKQPEWGLGFVSESAFWMDCGGHFKCQKFIGYVLCVLCGIEFPHLRASTLNFFAPQHGKGAANGEAANCNSCLVSAVLHDRTRVETVEDACEVLRESRPETRTISMEHVMNMLPQYEYSVRGLTFLKGDNAHSQFRLPPTAKLDPKQPKQSEFVIESRRVSGQGEWTAQKCEWYEDDSDNDE
jgi:hypothetical protein